MLVDEGAKGGGGQRSDSEQPAVRSGSSTSLSGFRILAVSAMKWTPQKTITSASVFAAACAECQAVADDVRDVLDLALLVVVREDDGVQFLLEAADVRFQVQAVEGRSPRGSLGLPSDARHP